MGIFNSVRETIKKYGSSNNIIDGDKVIKSKAFVEPLRYKNKVYIGGEYHCLGFFKKEKYLYVGIADNKLTENSTVIETNGEKYIVKRREKYYVKDIPIYVWAVLQPYGEVLEDDYDSDTETAG